MYSTLKDRLEDIPYKELKLVKGDYVEISTGSIKGYMTVDLSHLISIGIDTKDLSATIISDERLADNTPVIKIGYTISVGQKSYTVKNVIEYRHPFSTGYSTYEVLI